MAENANAIEVPVYWPLVITPENRDNTSDKDAQLVNCYMETQQAAQGDTQHWIYKRPGLLQESRPPAANASGFGLWNWLGNIYSIFGNTLYKNGVAVAGTVNTAGGVYHWTQCLGATPRMIFGNGVKGYYYDAGGGLVEITDADFPTAFVKGWAYLDGTIYVMKANAHIQGSDFNDPAAWDPLNDIVAQIEADQSMCLAKQLVYVVAFKQWSVEIFYDAANATGSPLGAVQGAKVSYGCVSAGSVQDIDGSLLWVGSSRTAGTQALMIESLRLQVISTKPIERLLQNADWTTTYSWQVSLNGHRFYVVTAKNSNITLAYDLDEKMWHRWTDVDGNYMPIVASTFDSSQRAILQHESNGRLYYCSGSYTNDNGVAIDSKIVTPNWDGGAPSRPKTLFREFFDGDQVDGCVFEVTKSDDDYRTNSTPRLVDMSKKNPYLDDCGTFYRRSQTIRHRGNTRFRLKAISLQVGLGAG